MASNAILPGLESIGKRQSTDLAPITTGGGSSKAFQGGASAVGGKQGAGKAKKKLKSVQQKASQAGPVALETQQPLTATIPEMKRGGWVRKTGLAVVHRGELVIPAKRSRSKASGARKRTVIKA